MTKTVNRKRHYTPINGEPVTHQSFKDECDINHMISKFQRTGEITGNPLNPQYLDVSNALDFQNAKNRVLEAEQAFSQLPAKLREQYKNDPFKFLEAVDDGSAQPILKELGLLPSEDIVVPDVSGADSAQPPKAESAASEAERGEGGQTASNAP